LFQIVFLTGMQHHITQKHIQTQQRMIYLVFLSFYTSSLNHRATSSLPGEPELGFHNIQKFYKSHTKITLLNKEKHQDF